MLDHRKTKGIPKNIYFCFIDYAKAFDHLDHKNYRKFFKRWKNYLSPEEAVCRTRSNDCNWTWNVDWFKIGKGVSKACILSTYLFNLHAEYIM